MMFSVRPLPEFSAWLDGLRDSRVRGAVAERIKRLSFGLLGDFKAIGDGVIELRIDFGAGWRLYYTQCGAQIILLLWAVPNARIRKISNGLRLWPHC
jgi:putative addiction module killer protein